MPRNPHRQEDEHALRTTFPRTVEEWHLASKPIAYLTMPQWHALAVVEARSGASLERSGVQSVTLQHLEEHRLVSVKWLAVGWAESATITDLGKAALVAFRRLP